MRKLFVLDDDESLFFALRYWFEPKGYEVNAFSSSEKFLEALQKSRPDFVLLDVYLARGEHGGELCYYLKKELHLSCPVFLFSSSLLSYSQFCEYKADGFFLKRASFDYLTKIMSSFLEKATVEEANPSETSELEVLQTNNCV